MPSSKVLKWFYCAQHAGNFIKIYELAEKYSRHSSLQIWIGLTDTEEDGQFKYISDGGFPLISFPWAGTVQD